MARAAVIVLWIVALFYAYGAAVHVANMLSLTGFDWPRAPFKWQVLDVVYLLLDIAVVTGFALRKRFGLIAFFAAAISQILLYTLLRSWILDVPAEFAVAPEQVSYLNGLVAFHVITVALVSFAARLGAWPAGWSVMGTSPDDRAI